MPQQPTFASVYDAYRQLNPQGVSLEDFARAGNEWTGSGLFDSAAKGGLGGVAKRGSYWLDQAVNATGAPEALSAPIGSAFEFFGADRAQGEELGRTMPRTMLDFAPMVAAGIFSGGTVPVGALIASGALGAANALEKTDSPLSAATAAVTPFVGVGAGHLASSAANKAMGWTGASLANSLSQRLGSYTAGQVGALGGMELFHDATALAQGQGLPSYDRNWILTTLISQLPFALADAPRLIKPKVAALTPTPEVKQRVSMLDTVESERARQLAEVDLLPDEVAKEQARAAVNEEHDKLIEDLAKEPRSAADLFDEPPVKQPFYQDPQITTALGKFQNGTPAGAELHTNPAPTLEGQPIEIDVPELKAWKESLAPVEDTPHPVQEVQAEIERRVVEDGDTLDEALASVEEAQVAKERNRGGRPAKMAYVDADGNTQHMTPRQAAEKNLQPLLDEQGQHLSMHADRERNGLWRVLDRNSENPKLKDALLAIDKGAWLSELDTPKQVADVLGYFERLSKAYKTGSFESVVKKKVETSDSLETQFAKLLHSAAKLAKSRKVAAQKEKVVVQAVVPEEKPVDVDDRMGEEAAREELAQKLEADSPDSNELASAVMEARERGEVTAFFEEKPAALGKVSAELSPEDVLVFAQTQARMAVDQLDASKVMVKELERLSASQLEVLNTVGSKKTGAKLRAEIANRLVEEARAARTSDPTLLRANDGKVLRQGRPAGAQFFFALQAYDPFTNKLGKHTLPRNGYVSEAQLKVMGGADRMLKNEEIALYKEIVPEAWDGEKVHVPTLDAGLEKAAPVVSVRKLDASNAALQRIGVLEHELDTLAPEWRSNAFNERNGRWEAPAGASEQFVRLVEEYASLQGAQAQVESSEAATGKYGVEPYDMAYLRGESTRQGGLQKALWAGDVVGQVPVEKDRFDAGGKAWGVPKFQSQHYGTEVGANQLFFVRGALHEYAPGSVLPTGEVAQKATKVFEAWEVQSDWAAHISRARESAAPHPITGNRNESAIRALAQQDYPLLDLWEPLALKTALTQAKAMGADMFALSDAESAMMTEGHDQYARREAPDGEYTLPHWNNDIEIAPGEYSTGRFKVGPSGLLAETKSGKWLIDIDEINSKRLWEITTELRDKYGVDKISQAGGMRLHYDKTGPSMLAKLTGSQGKMGDMGVHERAKDNNPNYAGEVEILSSREEAVNYARTNGYPVAAIASVGNGKWEVPKIDVVLKGSKVFRTPEGKPKTQNTARVYPLDKLSSEVTRFNIGGAARVGSAGETLDMNPSFENLYRRVAEKAGISGVEIQAALPWMRNLADRWNLQDVRFGELLADSQVQEQSPKGLGTVSGPVRKMWLAAERLEGGSKLDWHRNMLTLAAHEAGHLVDHLYRMGKMPAKARTAYEGVLRWKDAATPERLQATLRDAADSLLPDAWRKLPEFQNLLKAKDGDEALASLHGIWSLSHLTKDADVALGAALIEAQPRSYLRMLADYGKKFLGAMKGAFFGQKKYEQAADLKRLTDHFTTMKKGIAQATENLAKLQKFYSYDPAKFEVLRASSLEVLSDPQAPASVKTLARFMTADPDLPNLPKTTAQILAHEAARMFKPLSRVAEQNPVMLPAITSVLNAPGDARQAALHITTPLLGHVDSTGKLVPNSKEAAREQKLWKDNAKVNRAIADIDNWQQRENAKDGGGQPFDVSKPENSSQEIANTLKGLSPEERAAVLSYTAKHKLMTAEAQRWLADGKETAEINRLATVIAKRQPGNFANAKKIATLLHQGARFEMLGDLSNRDYMRDEAAKLGVDPQTYLDVTEFAKDSHKSLDELREFFAKSPGFSSLVRIGSHSVNAFDSAGVQVEHNIPASNALQATQIAKQLRERGLRPVIVENTRGKHMSIDSKFDKLLRSIDDRHQRRLQATFGGKLTPEEITKFAQDFSLAGYLQQASLVHSKFLPTKEGRSLQGMEEFDMVRQNLLTAQVVANTVAKWKATTELALQKANPVLADPNLAHLVKQVDDAMTNYQIPDSDMANGVNKVISTLALGANIPNHFAELFQPFTTVLSQATAEHGAVDSTKMLASVLKDTLKDYSGRALGKEPSHATQGEGDMIQTLTERGVLNRSPFTDAFDDVTAQGVAFRFQQRGNKLGYLGSVTHALGNATMRFYEMFNRHNTKIAARLGYRLAKKAGMNQVDATQYAERFAERAAYAGSRATRAITPFNEGTRGLGQVATVLQSYMMNFVHHAVDTTRRGWLMSDAELAGVGHGKTKAEIDAVRKRSKHAAMMLLGSQFLAAGALGLPFMGPAVKLFEELSGEDLRSDVYQAFGELMDEDQKEGSVLADGFMRGYLNTLLERAGLPLDLGSRFAIAGAPGLSEYSGFNANQLFGPLGGLVKSVVTGVSSLARDGNIMPLATSVAPTGLKKALDVAVNGDATDMNQNRMGLTDSEKALYALGFTPTRVRKLKEAERLLQSTTAARRTEQDKVEAQVLKTALANPQAGQAMLVREAHKLGVEPKVLAQAVAERQVKATTAKDFRSDIPSLDSQAAMNLLRGIGVNPGPSAETQKAQIQARVLAMLGLGQQRGAIMRARRADQRIAENPYLPLSVARETRPSFLW